MDQKTSEMVKLEVTLPNSKNEAETYNLENFLLVSPDPQNDGDLRCIIWNVDTIEVMEMLFRALEVVLHRINPIARKAFWATMQHASEVELRELNDLPIQEENISEEEVH